MPYVELDAIIHQPNWVDLPTDDFRACVSEVVASEGWVLDGNYPVVRDRCGNAETPWSGSTSLAPR